MIFHEDYYLEQKLQWNKEHSASGEWLGKTILDLKNALAAFDMTPEEHFIRYGQKEGLSPTPYFDEKEYISLKLAEERANGHLMWTEEKIRDALDKANMTPWMHYEKYGSREGVSPSKSFDADAYCAAKAKAMNATGSLHNGHAWGADDVLQAISDAHMTVLDHYETYAGKNPGEAPKIQYLVPNSTDASQVDFKLPSFLSDVVFTDKSLIADSTYKTYTYDHDPETDLTFSSDDNHKIVIEDNLTGSLDNTTTNADTILTVSGKVTGNITSYHDQANIYLGGLQGNFLEKNGTTTLTIDGECITEEISIGSTARWIYDKLVVHGNVNENIDTTSVINAGPVVLIDGNLNSELYMNGINDYLAVGGDMKYLSKIYADNKCEIDIRGELSGKHSINAPDLTLNIGSSDASTVTIEGSNTTNIHLGSGDISLNLFYDQGATRAGALSKDTILIDFDKFSGNELTNLPVKSISHFGKDDALIFHGTELIDNTMTTKGFLLKGGIATPVGSTFTTEDQILTNFLKAYEDSGALVAINKSNGALLYYSAKDSDDGALVELHGVTLAGIQETQQDDMSVYTFTYE